MTATGGGGGAGGLPSKRVPLQRPVDSVVDRWVIEDAGSRYVAFVVDGVVSVVDAVCPHGKGPIPEGTVRDGAIVCPWHFYAYDLQTGRCRSTGPAGDMYRLRVHPVVTVDGQEYFEVASTDSRSLAERLRAHARGIS